MSKYDRLYHFLARISSDVAETTLTFSEIENALGFKLPESAYNHRQWWANPTSEDDHPHAQSWLAAGWRVETVNQKEEWVRFQRS